MNKSDIKQRLLFILSITGLILLGNPFSGLAADAAKAQSPPFPPARPEALKRWQDMRFGAMISWGPSSVKGLEMSWSRGREVAANITGQPFLSAEEYDQLYKQFNPVKFNAEQIIGTIKKAGMKYVVLTTKHHDGFCLWNTRQTDYNFMHTPFGRDVTKELAEACRRQGVAFGVYYSVTDWHQPDYPFDGYIHRPHPDMARYTQFLRDQLTELASNYGPLITVWFDFPQMGLGNWKEEFKGGPGVIGMLRKLQPDMDILVNSRAGSTSGDYDTVENPLIGGFQPDRPWESVIPSYDQYIWKPNASMSPLYDCIQGLVSCACDNGNFLLNVGPNALGEFEPRLAARLNEIGAWLARHGESIYGTRGGPFYMAGSWKTTSHKGPGWHDGNVGNGIYYLDFGSTYKGNIIYLHILKWPGETLHLPSIAGKLVKSKVLAGGRVQITPGGKGEGLIVRLPSASRDPIDTIIKLTWDRPVESIKPVAVAEPKG